MEETRIITLASRINASVRTIDDQLKASGHPHPSFNADSIAEVPTTLQTTKLELLEALDELKLLIEGPLGMLRYLIGNDNNIRPALHAIARFHLAKLLPVGTDATYAELASAAKLPESDVRRILRMAMTYHVFRESPQGTVEHTATSRLLAESEAVNEMIRVTLNVIVPSGFHMVGAMEKWPTSSEPNHSGFNLMTGRTEPFIEAIHLDSTHGPMFARALELSSKSPLLSHDHLVNNFEWSESKVMVDIGGNKGDVSFAIARHYPLIQCIVQETENVIKQTSVPSELEDRIKFMAHDFFTPQPVRGADVYLLRRILHDWSDLYAIKIIRALIPALRSGSLVVVNEHCLANMASTSLYQQRLGRSHDLVMKQIQNGRERDREEWQLLFETADPHFKLRQVIEPPGSLLAIIVFVWNGPTAND